MLPDIYHLIKEDNPSATVGYHTMKLYDKDTIDQLEANFIGRLQLKTNWGRNEIITQLTAARNEVLVTRAEQIEKLNDNKPKVYVNLQGSRRL